VGKWKKEEELEKVRRKERSDTRRGDMGITRGGDDQNR
jgi:hypothetical protein